MVVPPGLAPESVWFADIAQNASKSATNLNSDVGSPNGERQKRTFTPSDLCSYTPSMHYNGPLEGLGTAAGREFSRLEIGLRIAEKPYSTHFATTSAHACRMPKRPSALNGLVPWSATSRSREHFKGGTTYYKRTTMEKSAHHRRCHRYSDEVEGAFLDLVARSRSV